MEMLALLGYPNNRHICVASWHLKKKLFDGRKPHEIVKSFAPLSVTIRTVRVLL